MNRRSFLLATTSSLIVAASRLSPHPTIEFLPSVPAPSSESLDRSRLLDCLAQVESGRNDQAVSFRHNRPIARGRYQIKEITWFQHTNRPWKLAHNLYFATFVAERHLMWLEKQVNPNPFDLAHAWRYGAQAGWVRNDDYPYRVHNLYHDSRS